MALQVRFCLRWECLLLAILLGFPPIQGLDPCQDLYKAACGNWSRTHAGDPYWSLMDQLDYDYQDKLAALLEQERPQEEPRFVQPLRDFYASCRRPLTLDQVLAILERMRRSGRLEPLELTVALTAAFRLSVLVEMEDWAHTWLQLLTRDEDWDPEETHREPMSRQQFDLLWLDPPTGAAPPKEAFWVEVRSLESFLTTDPASSSSSTSLQEWVPAFWMLPWPKSRPPSGFLMRLSRLLAELSPAFLLPYIQMRLRLKRSLEEGATSNSTSTLTGDWRIERYECAEQARQLMSHPAAWLVERSHPRLKEEPALQQLFEELKRSFGQELRANRNGFSRRTQGFLLAKLDRMRLRLSVLPRSGSPESVERRIERHYEKVQMDPSDYFGNLWAALRPLRQRRRWRKGMASGSDLFPVGLNRFGSYASPFYLVEHNLLIVPLSLLGPPLYSSEQPRSATYGALGFVLGHELSHGFGPDGVAFSARGKENAAVERELQRNHRFQRELRCLRRKFGGKRDEKFADLSGLQLAHSAYRLHSDPDADDDEERRFFLSFARFFCSDEGRMENSREHGSDRRRVNDAVAQFEPFRAAFSCPPARHRRQCRLF
ncbi:LOW QUALITY PROTEIN: phosphate-regulating neutral endopeptidase PHEX [Drosophila ficusphila]|uniref:LOW QUALITY PROTEIN: phosphate-regulating neutral endopeptidase PHEX n=1 Tax=Drosophila ficusphila TaxID=30025 RepID=UPI001C8ABDFD|nr:LOW QUALITY PROTEIN: phosphate-regulating neutral endopeptidase PHEX [Drosophila ficusphila]